MVFKTCIFCKKSFTSPHKKSKYCNQVCYGKSKIGNVPPNSGQFKIGNPINIGRKRPDMIGNGFLKGNIPWNKGLDYGKSNWLRKSNPYEYKKIHYETGRDFGKPKKCEFCLDVSDHRYHWANVSGKYTKERKDWLRLCPSCHFKYDGSQKI